MISLTQVTDLVLVGGSNRCVDILDVNVARIVRSMADCHTRPPHCISLNKVCQVGVVLVCCNDVIIVGVSWDHPPWLGIRLISNSCSSGWYQSVGPPYQQVWSHVVT